MFKGFGKNNTADDFKSTALAFLKTLPISKGKGYSQLFTQDPSCVYQMVLKDSQHDDVPGFKKIRKDLLLPGQPNLVPVQINPDTRYFSRCRVGLADAVGKLILNGLYDIATGWLTVIAGHNTDESGEVLGYDTKCVKLGRFELDSMPNCSEGFADALTTVDQALTYQTVHALAEGRITPEVYSEATGCNLEQVRTWGKALGC